MMQNLLGLARSHLQADGQSKSRGHFLYISLHKIVTVELAIKKIYLKANAKEDNHNASTKLLECDPFTISDLPRSVIALVENDSVLISEYNLRCQIEKLKPLYKSWELLSNIKLHIGHYIHCRVSDRESEKYSLISGLTDYRLTV